MKLTLAVFCMFTILLVSSCGQKHEEIITKRIQYDVNIKSPNTNYDWWIQNLVGPQREKLVKMLLKGAISGRYQTYDYYYHPLSKQNVAQLLSDTIWRKIRNQKPPYELKDTILIEKIKVADIQKLRFMEEWRVNKKDFSFEKKIVGIAPIAKRLDQEGNIRWQPLFWIFPDKDMLKSLQNNQ